MYDFVTRWASFVLAIGFLFGCSTTLPEMDQARVSLDKQRYKKALSSINKEIETHPENAEAYYLKGNILFELALNLEQPAERSSYYKDMRQTLLQSRDLYRDSLNTDESVELKNINDLLENGWRNEYETGLKLVRNDTLSGRNSIQKALVHFNNAITLIPDSTKPYQYKARLLYQQGNHQSAINTLTSILKNDQRPAPSILEQLAFLYMKTGSEEQSIALYEEALNQNVDNSNLMHGLVNAYIQRGNHRSAIGLLDSLIQQNPSNGSYRLSHANQLYQVASSHIDSIETFASQKETFRNSAVNDTGTTTAYEKTVSRQWASAKSLLRKAEKLYMSADSLSPDDPETDYSIAMFYKNKALDMQRIQPLLPDTSTDQFEATYKTSLKSAIGHLEEAVNQVPDHSGYWSQLYQLYNHFDMDEKARKARKRANL